MTFYSSLCLRLKVNSPAVIYRLLPPQAFCELGSPGLSETHGAPSPPHNPVPLGAGPGPCLAEEAIATVALGDDGSRRAETEP